MSYYLIHGVRFRKLQRQHDHRLHESIVLDAFWNSLDLANQELAKTKARENLSNMSNKEVVNVLNDVTKYGNEWTVTFRQVIGEIIKNRTMIHICHYCEEPFIHDPIK